MHPDPARVYKIATGGNSDTTGPSEDSYVDIPDPPASLFDTRRGIFSGACDPTTNRCYWALIASKKVAKTFNGVGTDDVTLESTSSALNENPGVIALDTVNQHLYVGTATGPSSNSVIYKMSTGGDSNTAPALLQTLPFTGDDGRNIWGLTVDPATGYGFMGTAIAPRHVVKFAMGDGDGLMTRIPGRAAAAGIVYGLGYNPVSGYVYTG